MSIFLLLLDFLFPKFCLICDAQGCYVCAECLRKRLVYMRSQQCHICNKTVYKKGRFTHVDCEKASELDGILAVVKYTKRAKKIVRNLKYGFVSGVAEELAPLLSAKLRLSRIRPDYVIPIPLFIDRRQWRGFNQAEILAQELNYPRFALERVKETHTQVGFDKEKRLQNLSEAFAIPAQENQPVIGRTFLLVDDVATTGSTMEECAMVLKHAGAAKVFGLVWARD